jgi:hypothetical protein
MSAGLQQHDGQPTNGCLHFSCSDWALAALIDIQKVATKARSKHSVQGHQCELRSAIDSICDRAVSGIKAELEHRRNQNAEPIHGGKDA